MAAVAKTVAANTYTKAKMLLARTAARRLTTTETTSPRTRRSLALRWPSKSMGNSRRLLMEATSESISSWFRCITVRGVAECRTGGGVGKCLFI